MIRPGRRDIVAGALAAGLASAARAQPMPVSSEAKALSILDLNDLEAQAEKAMAPGPFAFIAGGAGDEWTLKDNRKAFERYEVVPRYLTGIAQPDLSTSVLGTKMAMPIITAPMGSQGLAHTTADAGLSEGTGAGNGLMCASTVSGSTMEAIAAATKGPKWFQLYLPADRGIAREFLQRAKAAGYTAVAFTVDGYMGPTPTRAQRLGYSPVVTTGNYGGRPGGSKSPLDWADVEFVVKEAGLPVLLKGVLTADLASRALRAGCQGVWVSNHGGRQLDTLPASLEALPAVVRAVNGKGAVILDSGVRRGADVMKAMALGADAVAVGRPFSFALTLGGAQGVKSAYDRLRAEFATAMRVVGASNIAEIRPECVKRIVA